MAATFGDVIRVYDGPRRIRLVEVTLDSSYPTGGEALTAADLALQQIDAVFTTGGEDGWLVTWDQSALKLIAYGTGTATATAGANIAQLGEAPSAADLSAVNVFCLVIGR